MKVEQISWADAVKELDVLRAEIERLRAALEDIAHGRKPEYSAAQIAHFALRTK